MIEAYFEYRCWKGFEERFSNISEPQLSKYKQRLEYEINVIKQMGFCSYFLIIADLIRYAHSINLPYGPGRGSVGASLAANCLGIIARAVDPIRYNLPFERFLNPSRVSNPDIDLDFGDLRRDEIIDYIEKKYGSDCVARIGTYGSMKAKAAIRDAARVLGLDYQVGDKLARLVLPPISGKPQPLKVCYSQVPELAAFRKQTDRAEGKILAWAEKLEDRIRSFGQHAAGVLISPLPTWNYLPLGLGKDGKPTTQFAMEEVEDVGLVKFDVLGLKILTTIQRCINLIEETTGDKVVVEDIPIDDELTYLLLQEGDVEGVFQLENGQGMRDLVIKVKPTCLEDISAICAIYRPGPLGQTEALNKYLAIRAGKEEPEYLVPELEPILKETGNWCLYQEQAMTICREIAGYSNIEADNMRKIIGKKLPEKMAQEESKFKNGVIAKGFPQYVANQLWDELSAFASYSFNRSHSLSYGYISYITAYLKAHYPIQYLTACLISDSNEVDKIIKYINNCKSKKIQILPPDINQSEEVFSIKNNRILFGLSAIKNIGSSAAVIIQERDEDGPFLSLKDLIDRTRLNSKKLESLILSGACDSFNKTRAALLYELKNVYDFNKLIEGYQNKLNTYNKRIEIYNERQKQLEEWDTLTKEQRQGKKKPAAVKLPTKPDEPVCKNIESLSELPLSELLSHERDLLGYYISGHPLDLIEERSWTTISSLHSNYSHRAKVKFIAVPSTLTEITTRKTKQRMAYLVLEDKTGIIEAIALPEIYQEKRDLITSKQPAEYSGTIDIVENDDLQVVKVRITNVKPTTYKKEALPTCVTPLNLYTYPEKLQDLHKSLVSFSDGNQEIRIFIKLIEGEVFLVSYKKEESIRQEIDKLLQTGILIYKQ